MSETAPKNDLSNITLDWTVQDAMLLWLETTVISTVKPATYGHYRLQCRNHINPKLGTQPIRALDSLLLSEYFDFLMSDGRTDAAGGLSLKTVSDIRLIINAFFNALIINGITDYNPCNEVHMPPRKKKSIHVLSANDQRHLESTVQESHNTNALGILLSLHTGLRIGELCALQQQNVDVEHSTLQIKNTIQRIPLDDDSPGKTKVVIDEPKTAHSLRNITLPPFVLEALKPLLKSEPTDPLFSTKSGRFMEPRTYQDLFLRMLKKCDITPVNFHTLRHTFAVRSLESGVDVKSLSKAMGHSGASTIISTYSQFLAHPEDESSEAAEL